MAHDEKNPEVQPPPNAARAPTHYRRFGGLLHALPRIPQEQILL